MTEIRCCTECEFVGKGEYYGSHIWCKHPKANGITLPNRDQVIHPECPIKKIMIVRHVVGEYDRNVSEYEKVK